MTQPLKKYKVRLTETYYKEITVEATDEDDACDAAWEDSLNAVEVDYRGDIELIEEIKDEQTA
jgi:hypothetical protein